MEGAAGGVIVRLVAGAAVDRCCDGRSGDRLGRLRFVRDAVGLPARRTLLVEVGVGRAVLVVARTRCRGEPVRATVEDDPAVHAPAGKASATAASVEMSRRRPLQPTRLR